MKNRWTPPQLQLSGTNRKIEWILRKFEWTFENPNRLLLLLWSLYCLFDFAATYIFKLPTKGIAFGVTTAFLGFLSTWVIFHWIIPSFFLAKESIYYFTLGCIFIGILIGIKYFVISKLSIIELNNSEFFIDEILRSVDFFLISFLIWIFHTWLIHVRMHSKTEKKYNALAIAHKSLQMSPHFLMNLIGDIAGKSHQISAELFSDLTHYTNILSYAYRDIQSFNSLANEINIIHSYLHCQRLRFENKLKMVVVIDPSLEELRDLNMPKMLLLTLIENCFKHGEIRSSSYPIQIQILWNHDSKTLNLKTANKIKEKTIKQTSQFGLAGVKKLLEYHFPISTLKLNNSFTDFTLDLTLTYEN